MTTLKQILDKQKWLYTADNRGAVKKYGGINKAIREWLKQEQLLELVKKALRCGCCHHDKDCWEKETYQIHHKQECVSLLKRIRELLVDLK
jgi:hypothetical protein